MNDSAIGRTGTGLCGGLDPRGARAFARPTHTLVHRFLIPFLIAAASVCAGSAQAGDYPSRPIRMVVPFPAGGNADVVARLVSQALAVQLGGNIIIDNRGGANGIIGTEAVARAPADGYTLLFTTGSQAINPLISRDLPYDTLHDFLPVALVGVTESHLLVVNAASPIRSVRQLIDEARAPDSKLSYGSAGVGNTMHLVGEYFKSLTHTNLLHVPYRGSGPAINALMTGEVQLLFLNPVGAIDLVKQGSFRALAVTGKQRLPQLPDVPTLAEAGVPAFDLDAGWQGIFAPAGTPPQIVHKLNGAVAAVLKSPRLRQRLDALAMRPAGGPPAELDTYLHKDMEKFAQVVKTAHIVPQ